MTNKDDAKLVTACYRCAYKKGKCHRPGDKTCLDGILEWELYSYCKAKVDEFRREK